ncbi:hypothetical protein JHK87_012042 [Glycine soja]|nr:hypothetical protein JHK87_012042 [Glycine soja]
MIWSPNVGTTKSVKEHLRNARRHKCQIYSASGCERNWNIFEDIHSKRRNRLEHQKLNDLESPPFLTRKEVEALYNDLVNISIQSTSDYIYKLNQDEYEDDDVPQPPDNTMEDVNPNENNIGEESHSFDEKG